MLTTDAGCGRFRARLYCLSLSFICLGHLWLPHQSQAGSGGVSRLPVAGKLNTSGVRIVIDTRWVDANGYRPVRVEVIPLRAPAIEDMTFRIVIKPQSHYGNSRDSISQIVELPQGSNGVVVRIPVPQDSPWHSFVVDVYKDGRLLEDLSGDHLSWAPGLYRNWNEFTPCVLLIDSRAPTRNQRDTLLQISKSNQGTGVKSTYDEDLPDVRNLVRRFPDTPNQDQEVSVDPKQKKIDAIYILQELNDNIKTDVLNPTELPDRWIEFSSFDLIIISQSDLSDIAKQQPATLRAIADWVRAGHTLIVYKTGAEFAGLPRVEALLQLPPRPAADKAKYRGWREPALEVRGQLLKGLAVDGNYPQQFARQQMADKQAAVSERSDEDQDLNRQVDKKWAFVVRDAGLGNVVVFSDDPFPGRMSDWDWMLNSVRGMAWSPTQRTGASLQQRNEDFWNFLIPGTGQAPVMSFLVFITLFVMLIGPVNYYTLQRKQRLYLLLITVPAGAFLVTAGLFLYAMLTDGLGVKSRVRSYTTLDQRSGNVASTSRQAYYASIAPSQGFAFQDDTVIVPYLHDPVTQNGERLIRRTVNWSDHNQQLKGGYITSRTLSQAIVTRAASTKARLKVGKTAGEKLPVTNELQATLPYLLVMDDAGDYFAGENIPAGAAQLTKITSSEAAGELSKRLREFQPAFPDGYDESMHDSPLDLWSFGPRYYGQYGRGAQTSQASSLLERRLTRFSHLAAQPLEPRSYVAISETAPDVPLGVAKTKQYVSLHVIEGNW